MTLEPKLKEPDFFQTKYKNGKAFNFRVKIKDLQMAIVAIKVDLKSFYEVNMTIRNNSKMLQDEINQTAVKHLEIPFTVCMSTENEQPCPFTGDHFKFSDSNTITHKITRFHSDHFLYLQLKCEQDCLLKVTATTTLSQPPERRRTNSVKMRGGGSMYGS